MARPKKTNGERALFDFKRFIKEEFGSTDELLLTLNQYGEHTPLKRDTVRKWTERAGIPADWLAVAIVAKERESGKPVNLAPYLGVSTHLGGGIFD